MPILQTLRTILNKFRPQYQRRFLPHKVQIHRSTKLFWLERIDFGQFVYAGPNCMFNGEGYIEIGDGTIFGPEVVILSSTHDFRTGEMMPYDIYDVHRPVTIGKAVWVGYRAQICPGVTIGDGAIIAMGAVVTSDVAGGDIVGGNPASKIGERDPENLARRLRKAEWYIKNSWSGPRHRKATGMV